MGRRKKSADLGLDPSKMKVSLSSSMRAELEPEVFENDPARLSPPGSSRSSISQTSSTRSSSDSALKTSTPLRSKPAPIATEEYEYLNEPLSAFQQTAGTVSYDSVVTIDNMDRNRFTNNHQTDFRAMEASLELKEIGVLQPLPYTMASVMTDGEFAFGSRPQTAFPGATLVQMHRYGVQETAFVKQLMADICSMIDDTGRTDLQLKMCIEKEVNGLPILSLSLVHRSDRPTSRI